MAKIKNIVFDFDGVIADTADIIFALFQDVDAAILEETFLAHHDGNVYEEPKVNFSEAAQLQFRADYCNRLSLSHIAEAIEPIKRFAQNYRLFIISSNEEVGINAVLAEAHLKDCFEAVYGFNTHTSKVVKFEMLRDTFHINFAETVFVTDTLGDIKEGNAVGVTVIAETFGFHNRERLGQGDPHAIVDSWEEIESTIMGL